MGMIVGFFALLLAPIIGGIATKLINSHRRKQLLQGQGLSFMVTLGIFILTSVTAFVASFGIFAQMFLNAIR
jgi:uncharacterized membrane protein YqgA involved in biofilm formation